MRLSSTKLHDRKGLPCFNCLRRRLTCDGLCGVPRLDLPVQRFNCLRRRLTCDRGKKKDRDEGFHLFQLPPKEAHLRPSPGVAARLPLRVSTASEGGSLATVVGSPPALGGAIGVSTASEGGSLATVLSGLEPGENNKQFQLPPKEAHLRPHPITQTFRTIRYNSLVLHHLRYKRASGASRHGPSTTTPDPLGWYPKPTLPVPPTTWGSCRPFRSSPSRPRNTRRTQGEPCLTGFSRSLMHAILDRSTTSRPRRSSHACGMQPTDPGPPHRSTRKERARTFLDGAGHVEWSRARHHRARCAEPAPQPRDPDVPP